MQRMIIWVALYYILLLTPLTEAASIPTLTFTSKSQKADFMPMLYEGESFALTVEIYIRFGVMAGHKIGIVHHEGSFWAEVASTNKWGLSCIDNSSQHRSEEALSPLIIMNIWYHLAIVHTPPDADSDGGLALYIEGNKILEFPASHPRALLPNGVASFLHHMNSVQPTDGTHYFRNLRVWKRAILGSYMGNMKTATTWTAEYTKDLLLYALLNDNKRGMIDYSPNGMHIRGDSTTAFTSIETTLPVYSPHIYALHPSSTEIKLDISRVKYGDAYVLSFWMKYTSSGGNGVDILSGSLDTSCPRDTKLTMVQSTGGDNIKHYAYVFGNNLRDMGNIRTIPPGAWGYYYYSRDGNTGGTCQNYNAAGTHQYTFTCTANNHLHFCDQLRFYPTALGTYFQHFSIYTNYISTNMIRALQFSNYMGSKGEFPQKVVYLPLTEDPETIWYNRELTPISLITQHLIADHVAEASPPPYCPPYTHYTSSICNLATEASQRTSDTTVNLAYAAPATYYGGITWIFWMNIYRKHSSDDWIMYLPPGHFLSAYSHSGYNLQLRCMDDQGNYIGPTHTFTQDLWTFYAISCGKYFEWSAIFGNVYMTYAWNGRSLYNTGGTDLHFCHQGRNLFYIKEITLFSQQMNMNELKTLQYKNLFGIRYHRLKYVDFQKYGENPASTVDGHYHMRCPLNTILTYDHNACLLRASLGITGNLNLITSYMGVISDAGTFEFAFKILKWPSNTTQNIVLMKMGEIIKVELIHISALQHKLNITGVDVSDASKFLITPEWNIELNKQYSFAFALDGTSLNVYLNGMMLHYDVGAGALQEINDQDWEVQAQGGILLLGQLRVWNKQLINPEVEHYASAQVFARGMRYLMLYYPLDESQGTTVAEMSYKTEALRQNNLVTTLPSTYPASTFWGRFDPLIICPINHIYNNENEGNCTNHNGRLNFNPNSNPLDLKTVSDVYLTQFTIDFWFIFRHTVSDTHFVRIGKNDEIRIWYSTNQHFYFRIYPPSGSYYQRYHYVYDYRGWWFFARFQVNNMTGSSNFQMYQYIYYPVAKRVGHSTTCHSYDPISGPVRVLMSTTEPSTYMAHLSIWQKFIPNSHQNNPPVNAFYHPDYADPDLFGYYPFRSSLLDESGKGHDFSSATGTLSPEFKYQDWQGYSQTYEQPEYAWPNSIANYQFSFTSVVLDGCVYKYLFSDRLMLRKSNSRIESCWDIISDSTARTKITSDATCYFAGANYIHLALPSSHKLTNPTNIDLDPTLFYQAQSPSISIRATYSGNPFPTFIVTQGNLIKLRLGITQTITLTLFNQGTLNPLVQWKFHNLPIHSTLNPHSTITSKSINLQLLSDIFAHTPGFYPLHITLNFIQAMNYNYTDQITIKLIDNPKALIDGGETTIFKGENLKLSAVNSVVVGFPSEQLDYLWECSIDPTFRNIHTGCPITSLNTPQITIDTGSFTSNVGYYFRLKVTSEDDLTDEKIAKITILERREGIPFQIVDAGGLAHKYPKYSSSKENGFEISLLEGSPSVSNGFSYSWSITPNLINNLPLKVRSKQVLIPSESMNPDSTYILEGRASLSYLNGTRISTTQTKTIITSKLPNMGNVAITPDEGNIDTLFSINITNCVDVEDTNLLLYRVGYRQLITGDIASTWSYLGGWETKTEYIYNLGAGSKENGYGVEVVIEAKNAYGGVGKLYKQMKVELPIIPNKEAFVRERLSKLTNSENAELIINEIGCLSQIVKKETKTETNTADGCGGCFIAHGHCDILAHKCICNVGYTRHSKCSISDSDLNDKTNTVLLFLNCIILIYIYIYINVAMKSLVSKPSNIDQNMRQKSIKSLVDMSEEEEAQTLTTMRGIRGLLKIIVDNTKTHIQTAVKENKLLSEDQIIDQNTAQNGFQAISHNINILKLQESNENSVRNSTSSQKDSTEVEVTDGDELIELTDSLAVTTILSTATLTESLDETTNQGEEKENSSKNVNNIRVSTSNFRLKAGLLTEQDLKGLSVGEEQNSVMLPKVSIFPSSSNYNDNDTRTLASSTNNSINQNYVYVMMTFSEHVRNHLSEDTRFGSQPLHFGISNTEGVNVRILNLREPILLQLQLDIADTNCSALTLSCAAFDEYERRYRTDGMELVFYQCKDGIGTASCYTNHLSEFVMVANNKTSDDTETTITEADIALTTAQSSGDNDSYTITESPIFWMSLLIPIILILFSLCYIKSRAKSTQEPFSPQKQSKTLKIDEKVVHLSSIQVEKKNNENIAQEKVKIKKSNKKDKGKSKEKKTKKRVHKKPKIEKEFPLEESNLEISRIHEISVDALVMESEENKEGEADNENNNENNNEKNNENEEETPENVKIELFNEQPEIPPVYNMDKEEKKENKEEKKERKIQEKDDIELFEKLELTEMEEIPRETNQETLRKSQDISMLNESVDVPFKLTDPLDPKEIFTETNKTRKNNKGYWDSLCFIFASEHSNLNPFTGANQRKSQSILAICLSLELILIMLFSGIFYDRFKDEVEIFGKGAIGILALIISLLIMYILLRIFSPITSKTLDEGFTKVMRNIIGMVIWITVLITSIILINLIDKDLNEDQRVSWVFIFIWAIFFNFMFIQPVKCAFIHALNEHYLNNGFIQLFSARIKA